MKILVTGSRGMLGTDLIEVLKEEHEVIGTDIVDLDVTNIEQTLEAIYEIKPDTIINCAAYTNVDGCETNEELAFKVNAIGPRNLAVACNNLGASLVHISTDYVFPGISTYPYKENDLKEPNSVYGWSKLAGEDNVRSLCNRHYIVRTSWLFGLNGPNFVKTMLRLAAEKSELTVVNDQKGSPTFSKDLSAALATLILQPIYGTYHITNSGECTWFEFTRDILNEAGIKNISLKPITTEELNRPACRPAYSVMDNFNWRLHGFAPMRHYKEALKDYLALEKANK